MPSEFRIRVRDALRKDQARANIRRAMDGLMLKYDQAYPDKPALDALRRRGMAIRAHALGRLPESLDWVLFDELNPYSGDLLPLGTLCSPSPGELNVCSAVPAQESSFGYLKSLHFFVP